MYLNKALALERERDFDGALSFYEKSLQAWTFCVEELNMFWIMPKLLETLRYRLMTLRDLQRWPAAARDVLQFLTLYTSYLNSDGIDDGLKEAAGKEFTQMISRLRALTPERRELLFAELGDQEEAVRSLVEG